MNIEITTVKINGEYIGTELKVGERYFHIDEKEGTIRNSKFVEDIGETFERETKIIELNP